MRLAEQEHDFTVVLGPVEQPPELAHGIVGGTTVLTSPPAIMLRGLSVLTGALAIAGCMRAVIGRTPALLSDFDGLVVRHGGIALLSHLVSLLCCCVRVGRDL